MKNKSSIFKKILIANRGDVALRILRAAKDLKIPTVSIHSSADNDAMHVKLADESVCIGPAKSSDSYLNKQAIISAALVTGADAIHPGVGFLSENADFAEIVNAHGIKFIGPSPKLIRTMGDKVSAKIAAEKAGLPLVPGSKGSISSLKKAEEEALNIGFPVILKAAAGGGGRGRMPERMACRSLAGEEWRDNSPRIRQRGCHHSYPRRLEGLPSLLHRSRA